MTISFYDHKTGQHLLSIGNYSKALVIYQNILKFNPKDFEACNNLGYIFLQQNLLSKSIHYYLRAININRNEVALNGLASAYFFSRNFNDAQNIYLEILKKNPSNLQTILNISNLYFILKKFKLAKKYYLKFYQYEKKSNIFHRCIAKVNSELGVFSETLVFLKKAIRLEKNNLFLKFLYLNQFPKIHNSKFDKKRLIQRFELILDKLHNHKNEYIVNEKQIVEIFTSSTNFYLAYCRDVNKKINKKYFELITFFTKKIHQNENIKYYNDKKRVAVISSFFYNHTVGRLFQNLIISVCKSFETTIYHLGEKEDFITHNLKKNSFSFVKNSNINLVIDNLKSKNFDIIFFPEIGMCLKTQILASMRFARYQIVSWGHPITTGSDCIDYFLSNELMESSTSKNDYTEKIVKLSDIGIDIDSKIFPSGNKLISNGIREKILNLQSLFKILPEDDNFYFETLKKIPNIKFFFIKDSSDFINKKFFHRLKKGFGKYFENNIKFEQSFFFLERLNRKNFIANMQNYDLILDTFEWSGGNSSIEALLNNIPIVTIPSKTMKSRHTTAFLAHIGLSDLIVENQSKLIILIERLMRDDYFYNTIFEKIKKSKENLYMSKSSESFVNFLKNLNISA
jgi:predicted O-linked N-acetylglucosamine transferase (SPINDLY family)